MGRQHFCYVIEGPSGVYVGKTSRSPDRRWREHQLEHQKRPGKLYAAMRAYGIERFSFEVVLTTLSEDDAYWCERTLVAQHRQAGVSLYNLTEGGEGIALGTKMSDETKRRMSAARKGVVRTSEFKERVRAGVARWWANREPSPAQLAKRTPRRQPLSAAQKKQLSERMIRIWKEDSQRREKQSELTKRRHERGEFGVRLAGEANPFAKLSSAQVKEIRELHVRGVPRKELELRFGVSKTQIARILRGESRRTA